MRAGDATTERDSGAGPARSGDRWLTIGLFLIATVALFTGAGGGSLVDSDDAMYAQMAREAVRDGSWLTLTFHGAPVFEKPPLYFWLLGASMATLGEGELALRLVSILASLASLALVFRITRRLAGPDGVAPHLAVASLAASGTFYFLARRTMTDPLFVAWGLGAIELAFMARRRPRAVYGVTLALAAALLTKWVAAAIFTPPVIALLAPREVRARIGARRAALAVAAGAVAASPWFLHQALTHGDAFWRDFVLYHVIARGSSSLVGETGLWGALSDLASVEGLSLAAWLAGLAALRRHAALAWWLGAAGLPFLVSPTRLPHYVLPALPALAVGAGLTAGRALDLLVPAGGRRLATVVALLGFGGVFLANNAFHLLRPDYAPDERRFGEAVRDTAAGDVRLVYNAHDLAISWYAGAPFELFPRDPKLATILRSIPALARGGLVSEGQGSLAERIGTRRAFVLVPKPFAPLFEQEAALMGRDGSWKMWEGLRYRLYKLAQE
jgi:4-amino-4-deoxy-L-arabinose transferase-like glycosyltransferase